MARSSHVASPALSEIMTILVHFHRTSYRTFKAYYSGHVEKHLPRHFPKLVSYKRFVELMPRALLALCCFAEMRKGRSTGIAFIDSTPLAVCHNRRIHQQKVFDGLAARGKTSVGWFVAERSFFGFKLHLVVNDRGERLSFCLRPVNTDERAPVWCANSWASSSATGATSGSPCMRISGKRASN